MVNEFYQGLPSNYANYEDVVLPKHESMKEKTRREGVYGYYDHWNKDAYTWIDRFLEDSVGKKFDNVYPKVCERFRKKKDFGFRKEFKSKIDPRNMSDVCWYSNNYYLDSNHIIRRYKPIKNDKRRKYVMELDRSEDYYIVNKEKLFLEHPEIVLYLKAKLGKDIDYIIASSERLSNDLGKKVQECITEAIGKLCTNYPPNLPLDYWYSPIIRNKRYKRYKRLSTSDLIKCYYDSINKTYYEGTPEYSKHYYEERSAERKRMREYRKEEELVHAQMLKDSLIRANAEKWIRKNTRESN